MHFIFLCRSLSSTQKAVRLLQKEGLIAAMTKAPQAANPGGCTYGVRVAERYASAAVYLLKKAGIPVLKILEDTGNTVREVRL